MICWCCHSNSVNTGSSLPNISDVKTWKRRNMIRIDMIRNNHIRFYPVSFQLIQIISVFTLLHCFGITSRLSDSHLFWKACVDRAIIILGKETQGIQIYSHGLQQGDWMVVCKLIDLTVQSDHVCSFLVLNISMRKKCKNLHSWRK
jgi:hypothetical protein